MAVASLPADQRADPLEVLAEQVTAVEEAVGAFATDGLDGTTDAGAGLAALSERLDHLAAAHAELDALEQRGDGPDLDALADRLDAERDARRHEQTGGAGPQDGGTGPQDGGDPTEGRPQPGTG